MPDPKTIPAVVCDMTTAPDSAEQRVADYARLFEAAFVSRERTEVGFRWRLRADPGIRNWAQKLAARENICCAFMSNTITVEGEHVLWDATTIDDPAARAVLDKFYDLPSNPRPDLDTLQKRFVEEIGVPVVIVEASMTRPATLKEIRTGRRYSSVRPVG